MALLARNPLLIRGRPWDVGGKQFRHPRPVRRGDRPTPERERLLKGLSGQVLEIGAGDGVKVTCYPRAVSEIVLIEDDPFQSSPAVINQVETSGFRTGGSDE
ncbi:hypothetical protein [Nonomuraea roseola]|uniref:Methyltransferase n=1 Tax=Nonomuraea roseola TaxID=46179 RepID=A0ABV5Q6H2_9ACTN